MSIINKIDGRESNTGDNYDVVSGNHGGELGLKWEGESKRKIEPRIRKRWYENLLSILLEERLCVDIHQVGKILLAQSKMVVD